MKTIGGLFGRSAYGPVHEHMLKVLECVERVPQMLKDFATGALDAAYETAREVHRLEGEADGIKQEIRDHLSGSMFSSVERSDVLLLLKSQDNVADAAQELANLLEIRRKTVFPPRLVPEMERLATQVRSVARSLAEVTSGLRNVMGSLSGRSEAEKLAALTERISREEFEADLMEKNLLIRLFEEEENIDPLSVFFVFRIIKELSSIADEAENAADCIHRMLGAR